MDLRSELMPPQLSADLVEELSRLAAEVDGARAEDSELTLAQFNQLAGTALKFAAFQGVHGAEDHEDWVRRILYSKSLSRRSDLIRDEMIEIVRRIVSAGDDHDFYLLVFEENCKHPAKSGLIYYPDLVPELPQDREPTEAEIADLAMSYIGPPPIRLPWTSP